MKNKNIEELLENQRPTPRRELDSQFTAGVVSKIRSGERAPRRFARLRRAHTRLARLPKYALATLAIVSIGSVSTAAYAAYVWLKPSVQLTHITASNDDNKREFAFTTQCDDPRGNLTQRYELARGATLSDQQVYDIVKNTCDYQALGSFIDNNTAWQSDNSHDQVARKKPGDLITIYDHSNIALPAPSNTFGITLGKITAIDGGSVTIQETVYSEETAAGGAPVYTPNGAVLTHSIPLLGGYQVWSDGKRLADGDVHVGDTVQLTTRSQYAAQKYDFGLGLGPLKSFGVIGIVKTTLDPSYVIGQPSGNPTLVDSLATLSTCYGNDGFMCVNIPNQRLGMIYDATENISPNSDNKQATPSKYLRKDISKLTPRTLNGRITAINGARITLQGRGTSKTFTVELPYDAISEYNKTSKTPVSVGDLISVNYGQDSGENPLQVQANELEAFAVMLHVSADGSLAKY
ncbi:MAG TPA: hypothetical protein VLG11_04500 [Candidatus Saccharimonadales bacterium]|nr:hypothetical protein [Candidatus Saccharimonadales bacterium]